jgi:hypothetical protein
LKLVTTSSSRGVCAGDGDVVATGGGALLATGGGATLAMGEATAELEVGLGSTAVSSGEAAVLQDATIKITIAAEAARLGIGGPQGEARRGRLGRSRDAVGGWDVTRLAGQRVEVVRIMVVGQKPVPLDVEAAVGPWVPKRAQTASSSAGSRGCYTASIGRQWPAVFVPGASKRGIVTGKRLEPTLGFEPRTCCLRSRSA